MGVSRLLSISRLVLFIFRFAAYYATELSQLQGLPFAQHSSPASYLRGAVGDADEYWRTALASEHASEVGLLQESARAAVCAAGEATGIKGIYLSIFEPNPESFRAEYVDFDLKPARPRIRPDRRKCRLHWKYQWPDAGRFAASQYLAGERNVYLWSVVRGGVQQRPQPRSTICDSVPRWQGAVPRESAHSAYVVDVCVDAADENEKDDQDVENFQTLVSRRLSGNGAAKTTTKMKTTASAENQTSVEFGEPIVEARGQSAVLVGQVVAGLVIGLICSVVCIRLWFLKRGRERRIALERAVEDQSSKDDGETFVSPASPNTPGIPTPVTTPRGADDTSCNVVVNAPPPPVILTSVPKQFKKRRHVGGVETNDVAKSHAIARKLHPVAAMTLPGMVCQYPPIPEVDEDDFLESNGSWSSRSEEGQGSTECSIVDKSDPSTSSGSPLQAGSCAAGCDKLDKMSMDTPVGKIPVEDPEETWKSIENFEDRPNEDGSLFMPSLPLAGAPITEDSQESSSPTALEAMEWGLRLRDAQTNHPITQASPYLGSKPEVADDMNKPAQPFMAMDDGGVSTSTPKLPHLDVDVSKWPFPDSPLSRPCSANIPELSDESFRPFTRADSRPESRSFEATSCSSSNCSSTSIETSKPGSRRNRHTSLVTEAEEIRYNPEMCASGEHGRGLCDHKDVTVSVSRSGSQLSHEEQLEKPSSQRGLNGRNSSVAAAAARVVLGDPSVCPHSQVDAKHNGSGSGRKANRAQSASGRREKMETLTHECSSALKLSESDVVTWPVANGEIQNDHFQVLIEEAKTVADTPSGLKANPNSNAAQDARDQLREKKKLLREKLHQCNRRPEPRAEHNDDEDELF